MQAGELMEVLLTHPFFAAILKMAVQRDMSFCQPSVQRFDINAQASGRFG